MEAFLLISVFAIGFMFGTFYDWAIKRIKKHESDKDKEIEYFKTKYINLRNDRSVTKKDW